MRRHSSPLALYKAQLALFARLNQSRRQMHLGIALEGRADYDELLSGTLSPNQTRGRFARRRSGRRRTGGVRLLPINQQSGRLRRSVKIRKVNTAGAIQSFHVGPTSAAGKSMFALLPAGTRFTVARGAEAVIKERFRARNKAFFDTIKQRQRN